MDDAWKPLTLTVAEYANAVQIASPQRVSYADAVRTRDELVADVLRQRLYEEQQVGDRIARERTELRGELRTWQTAYWILSCLFLIMFIAALWGWLR